jgi:hypothetical protein
MPKSKLKNPFHLSQPRLSARQRNRFTALRGQVASLIKAESAESFAHSRAVKQVAKLAEEIARLEQTINPADGQAVASLNSRRTQHELLTKRLAAPPVKRSAKADDAGVQALAALRASLGVFFKEYLEVKINQFAEILTPLFDARGTPDPDAHAANMVRHSPMFYAFSDRYIVRLRDQRDNIFSDEAVIAIVDALLSGKYPFTIAG